jgi:hypothetical protein
MSDREMKCLGIDVALKENAQPVHRMISVTKSTYIDKIHDVMIDDERRRRALPV